jgi:hypothetical protein
MEKTGYLELPKCPGITEMPSKVTEMPNGKTQCPGKLVKK